MSEIADAVQIIRVTYDGIEIALKMGSASIHSMQKALDLIVGMLAHEKEMGRTNLKGLLAKGGDIQVLSFADDGTWAGPLMEKGGGAEDTDDVTKVAGRPGVQHG